MNRPLHIESSQPISQTSLSLGDIYQRLNLKPDEIAAFCEKWRVVELALFGSVLRNDFRAGGNSPSDIDVLYASAPDARYGFKFLDMKSELETLLNRKVDLISKRGIQRSRNPLRRQEILQSARKIYVKGSAVYS
ncbi:MAG: nucleotidyltransferase family protein [Leptolyngbyaceae cyanobacterium]